MELVVEGNAYIQNRLQKCSIGIENGQIVQIKKILHGEKHLDFREKVILPTMTDVHVHFRDPGMTYKEDFYTGTKAAAFGGVSCILDMPNTSPPTIDINSLTTKLQIAQKKACIDYGLYAGITENNIKHLTTLIPLSKAFKAYLTPSNGVYLPLTLLPKAMAALENTGKVLAIHAEENDSDISPKQPIDNLASYNKSRPPKNEVTAIQKIIELSKNYTGKTHICHVSSKPAVVELQKSGNTISAGVTPHHLFFQYKSQFHHTGFGKVNPPLRTKNDSTALTQGLRNGIIDIIESDHAPHSREEKENIIEAPAGIPGVETTLPLLLGKIKQGWLTLHEVIDKVSRRPCEIFNIQKGELKIGNDADFIITDMKQEKIGDLHSKCGWSPFQGEYAVFPKYVYVRGERIIDNKEFMGTAGMGRRIP